MSRGILWDLDGTLVDSEPAHRASFALAINSLGLALPENFEQRVLGTSERYVYELLRAESDLILGPDEWRQLKWQFFEKSAHMIEVRTETQAALQHAISLKTPMAIVTNSTTDELNLNIKATALPQVFGSKVSGQDVSKPKPAPEGYLKAAMQLKIMPNTCIVVEDSLPGTKAGLAGGMQTILYPQHEIAADAIPEGSIYLPPGGNLWNLLQQFL